MMMWSGRKRRGYSLMELVVGMMLVAIALALFVPDGKGTKSVATTKSAAEELVARFRAARQTAMTKGVPVAVAIPNTNSIFQSDEGFQLEGETNPKVTQRWKIQQQVQNVVYFTGDWPGPAWAPAPVLTTAHNNFDPDPVAWFAPATPPQAKMYIFTPAGNAVSDENAADGRFRIIVAMGVDSGGSSTLTAVNSPFTVWIDPSGEIGFDRGVWNGAAVANVNNKESLPLAPYVPLASVANVDPVVVPVPPSTGAMSYPNNVNPKTNNGNVVNLDSVLTLEVRVKDANGDPPYFQWETYEVGEYDEVSNSFSNPGGSMAEWGGRFSNTTEVRMEWDAEKKEWVGRDTWAPSTKDLGGNRYKLRCNISDRKGGTTTAQFPVDGHYLVTSKEPWVLYKTWNSAGVVELWKMTLDGLDHTPLVQFGYQNVEFGQWSPSGAEVIVGAPDGVWRVTANGENLQLVSSVVLPGGIDGCCISPQGDAVYYIGGLTENKRIRKVWIDPNTATQEDVPLNIATVDDDTTTFGKGSTSSVIDEVYDLSAARFENGGTEKVVLLHTMYHYYKKKWKVFGSWKTKKKYRWGAMAVDAATGNGTPWSGTTHSAGNWSKPPQPWLMDMGQNGTTNYGISIHNTDVVMGSTTETHILYGDAAGNIHAKRVNPAFTASSDISTFAPELNELPGFPKSTPQTDTHHPKYASPDRGSIIYAAGRNQASQIYYMPNVNTPGTTRRLNLSPANQGAEAPSVSRPR